MTVKGKLSCDVCTQEIVFTSFVCDDCQREISKKLKKQFNLHKEINDRVDGFGFPVLIFLFAGTSYLIIEDHGWAIAIFIFILETVILELAYRLSTK
jgi:hypothetical protein